MVHRLPRPPLALLALLGAYKAAANSTETRQLSSPRVACVPYSGSAPLPGSCHRLDCKHATRPCSAVTNVSCARRSKMLRLPGRLLPLALVVMAALAPSAAAAPAYRIENAMVYDTVGRRHVMFGGFDSHVASGTATRFNDIWEYVGATRTWYNVTPTSGSMPAPRSGHALAFDATRRVVVLFGGWNQSQGYLNDTWEWNCTARTWTRISPSTSPSARQGGRLTYDVGIGRVILVGGVDANRFYNETWRYDRSTWTRVTTSVNSPAGRTFNGRTFHGLIYHATRGTLIIFGGIGYPNGATQGTVTDFNDMWELRGTTWTDITPSGSPGARGWLGMTYESATTGSSSMVAGTIRRRSRTPTHRRGTDHPGPRSRRAARRARATASP